MPLIQVSGSEHFEFVARTPAELRAAAPALDIHTVDDAAAEAIDPLTYEVIRHRLAAITEDMGAALKRMSPSSAEAPSAGRPCALHRNRRPRPPCRRG